MAMIDGTLDARNNCLALFNRVKDKGRIPSDLPFEAREIPTDPKSTTIRVVAIDRDGNAILGTGVEGVRTATDSTRLALLGAPL